MVDNFFFWSMSSIEIPVRSKVPFIQQFFVFLFGLTDTCAYRLRSFDVSEMPSDTIPNNIVADPKVATS